MTGGKPLTQARLARFVYCQKIHVTLNWKNGPILRKPEDSVLSEMFFAAGTAAEAN